jgi:hypothetical protein
VLVVEAHRLEAIVGMLSARSTQMAPGKPGETVFICFTALFIPIE